MNRLNSQIWLGDAEDAINVSALSAAGVSAILNITREQDNPRPIAPNYCQLDHDDGVPFAPETLATGLTFLRRRTEEGTVTLIHCAAGISRTAAMAIAWLMTAGFSWDEGEAIVRAARFCIQPHPELKRSVLQLFKRWPYDGSMAA